MWARGGMGNSLLASQFFCKSKVFLKKMKSLGKNLPNKEMRSLGWKYQKFRRSGKRRSQDLSDINGLWGLSVYPLKVS